MMDTAQYAIDERLLNPDRPESLTTDSSSMDRPERLYLESRHPESKTLATAYSEPKDEAGATDSSFVVSPEKVVAVPASIMVGAQAVHYSELQRWDGIVDAVEKNFFTATIKDLTDPSKPNESVEIELEELGDTDRARVKPGALFVWCIAYKNAGTGRQTVSEIRFRRMRKWTKQAQVAAEKKADFIRTVLGIE